MQYFVDPVILIPLRHFTPRSMHVKYRQKTQKKNYFKRCQKLLNNFKCLPLETQIGTGKRNSFRICITTLHFWETIHTFNVGSFEKISDNLCVYILNQKASWFIKYLLKIQPCSASYVNVHVGNYLMYIQNTECLFRTLEYFDYKLIKTVFRKEYLPVDTGFSNN